MLKYHVAVCDDEKSDLDGIVQSVQQYDVQGCFDIETYMDGNELLSELQMQKKCSAYPMAAADHCDSNRKYCCLLCGTVSCCG